MTSAEQTLAPPRVPRNLVIAGVVVALHVVALWAMQASLLQRAVEVIVPVQLLSEFIEPPKPKPAPPAPPPPPAPIKRPTIKSPPPAPMPLAIADPTPAPDAPVGVTTPQPPAPPIAAPAAPPAPPPAPPAPPAPPKIELPSSAADYLQNPSPPYPTISRRLGEQGKVVVRVLIGTDGLPQKAEIRQSSGYERLDQAAYNTVLKWRYVPGKRNGAPEAMWFNIPLNFVLE
ncbi:energy transducer TonB [Ramlibacter sp. H39-3-26]|uniref:energy transducer TonB n=1 Tax=Curvibacter soli TaxID=3031331 RepID=UPI0023DB065C|nr:energy transducer TonB [Ramlibacter sp. H39-3-26]MDF1485065.1 energy transducer TonB [Ramlibacter sp. H39-3-26]